MLSSEIDALAQNTPTGSQYCSYLNRDGDNFRWSECSQNIRYLCEYKGIAKYNVNRIG